MLGAQQPSAAGGRLFVTSDPIGAVVFIDGEQALGVTPLRIPELEAGRYQVEVRKSGFAAVQESVEVEAGGATALRLAPVPLASYARIEGPPGLRVEGVALDPEAVAVELSPGTIRIEDAPSGVALERMYPHESLRRSLLIATPALAALTAVLAVEDVAAGDSPVIFEPGTFFSFGLTAAGAVLAVSLSIEKRNYERIPLTTVRSAERGLGASERYALVEELFQAGLVDAALEAALDFAEEFPEAADVPRALLRAGQLNALLGNAEAADALLTVVAEEYPDPAVYNPAILALLDRALLAGDAERSRSLFERIEPGLPGISADELGFLAEEIERLDASKSGGEE
jgi:hypothetical protein